MGRRVALLIGINKCWIGDWPELRYAESDCHNLADALCQRSYDFHRGDVHIWTASDTDPQHRPIWSRLLYDTLPVTGGSRELDLFVFSFAGHGVEVDGRPYLIPVDGVRSHVGDTCVPLSALLERISAVSARQRLIIFDACFVAPDGRCARGVRPKLTRSFKNACEAKVVAAVDLSSCDVGEESYECDDLQGGVLSYFWCEGLNHFAEKSPDHVTVFDVETYAEEKVRD